MKEFDSWLIQDWMSLLNEFDTVVEEGILPLEGNPFTDDLETYLKAQGEAIGLYGKDMTAKFLQDVIQVHKRLGVILPKSLAQYYQAIMLHDDCKNW